jgi:hypothetical protein
MSVSKSVVGCVAGILASQGRLDLRAAVTAYVPEVGCSGYAGATIRDLLDMRTGVGFRETYTALDAEVRVMERSMGWRPARPGDPAGAYPYLATLGSAGPHGGEFTYRSADSDMLGWVCERASGLRMADLISALIWRPIGAERDAEITCDPLGSAIHDGGISASARDLARFGQMLVDDGWSRGGALDPVVPEAWLADVRSPEPGVREAFAVTDNECVLPGGWYRNQFWVLPAPGGPDSPVLVCLGIYGQLIYADRAARTVVVKLSSWPDAQNTAYLLDTLRACAAVAASLSCELSPRSVPLSARSVRGFTRRIQLSALRCCHDGTWGFNNAGGPRPVSGPEGISADAEVSRLFERRTGPTSDLAGQADAVADACHAMAVRFHRGGKLVVFGAGGASTDAQHVAVEFVHPVIVGKRALPAISLTTDVATVTGIAEREGVAAIFAHQLRFLADPADIALGISADGNSASVLGGLEAASELGLLTIALAGGDGGLIGASKAVDHLLIGASADPQVVKELHVTLYHVLWELVHVFFEQPGLLAPGVVA